MKTFFNKKRIAFITTLSVSLFVLIILLIVPIGSLSRHCLIYSTITNTFGQLRSSVMIIINLDSPFTIGNGRDVLVAQTIVFTLVAIVFVVFSVLFAIELKRAGVFTRRQSKTARMQAQIDELQKKVEELQNKD